MKYTLTTVFAFILLFLSALDVEAQWTKTSEPDYNFTSGLVSQNSILYASIEFGFNGTGGIYFSKDNGGTWTSIGSSFPDSTDFTAIEAAGNNLIVGTYGRGAFVSSNNGSSWSSAFTPYPQFSSTQPAAINVLDVKGTVVYAATTAGVYASINNGSTWLSTGGPMDQTGRILNTSMLASDDTALFAEAPGTSNGLYMTTGSSGSWTPFSTPQFPGGSLQPTAMVFLGKTIICATTYALYRSIDNGVNWDSVGPGDWFTSMAVYGNDVFAGALNGVYLSADSGKTWTVENSGLTTSVERNISNLCVNGSYLFAGTYMSGIWRRQISDMITSVQQPNINVPSKFSLNQNYPNPFNPTTTIEYELPVRSNVLLNVYDILGNKVATLVNEVKNAGTYYVQFNGTSLSSGIYFYRMEATGKNGERFSSIKKIVLLK